MNRTNCVQIDVPFESLPFTDNRFTSQLRQLVCQHAGPFCGRITDVRVPATKIRTGTSLDDFSIVHESGFVAFDDWRDAARCRARIDGIFYHGVVLAARFAKPPRAKPQSHKSRTRRVTDDNVSVSSASTAASSFAERQFANSSPSSLLRAPEHMSKSSRKRWNKRVRTEQANVRAEMGITDTFDVDREVAIRLGVLPSPTQSLCGASSCEDYSFDGDTESVESLFSQPSDLIAQRDQQEPEEHEIQDENWQPQKLSSRYGQANLRGVCVRYDQTRGFGFIRVHADSGHGFESGSRDVFVHCKHLREPLHQGDAIVFDADFELSRGKFRAINVFVTRRAFPNMVRTV